MVELWIALFGRSESASVAGICRQFWEADWAQGIARRAIFDVARVRFPIQSQSLIRLLRSMTASGFLDTDPLSTADHGFESADPEVTGSWRPALDALGIAYRDEGPGLVYLLED